MDVSVRIITGDMRSLNVLFSANRYICWVALGNCTDYFEEVGVLFEKNKKPIIKKNNEIKIFRLFLNSIESLNNIIDYIYLDKYSKSFKNIKCFKSKLLDKYSILVKINEIANAYKHCERRDAKKLKAKDIRFDHEVLVVAFKFWADYHDKDGKVDLLV